jgi:predicted site-specific integrase-resolvase
MATTTKREPLATTAEVAEYLGISAVTLRRWRSQGGRGPRYQHVGRWVRYRWSDVENPDTWLENQPTATPPKRRTRRNLRTA